MGCFKVMIEGHSFVGEIDGRKSTYGFYTTVEVFAQTRQEFAHEVEQALGEAISKSGLSIVRLPFRRSFCRISNTYSVADSRPATASRGMTLFYENPLNSGLFSVLRMLLIAFKPRELVEIK